MDERRHIKPFEYVGRSLGVLGILGIGYVAIDRGGIVDKVQAQVNEWIGPSKTPAPDFGVTVAEAIGNTSITPDIQYSVQDSGVAQLDSFDNDPKCKDDGTLEQGHIFSLNGTPDVPPAATVTCEPGHGEPEDGLYSYKRLDVFPGDEITGDTQEDSGRLKIHFATNTPESTSTATATAIDTPVSTATSTPTQEPTATEIPPTEVATATLVPPTLEPTATEDKKTPPPQPTEEPTPTPTSPPPPTKTPTALEEIDQPTPIYRHWMPFAGR